ncbi:GGDEF domain-containing phosphodiesterase [Sphingomonas sp.]|uniref:GGDEF domain-containing phosphodiesterase n=1 Tax=Sphingomonas sp. TaxID=28214 RepID=UPI002D803DA8|nr:GGDEF domain-containing phosphodiesterase [Sphingomonas sp.]HEU0043681.1 GGDEF domain-containing phosphodiesterase [Sphingomonas sp.]
MLDAPRAGQRVHLALVEIAQFAALRRMVGVQRADLLVLDVAERIASAVSKARVETVGRNLVEVSFTTHSPADVEPVVATIHAAFDQPVCIDGEFHSIGVTIGVAEGPGTESCAVLLVEEAEAALINARRRDPHGSTQAPAGSSPDVAQISRELQEAVGRDELFVQYQPKLHLRRQQIVSVEALIRWLHPTRGLVLPNDFIPVAEQTGDISDITLWTIKRVIADQRVMIRNGHPMPVFINMAGQLLSDTPFIDEVIALIESSGARLGVEITETSVIRDPQGAIKHLERLAAIGVVVTIDDYGAGLSSLAYLKQLPASELKIDKLFVTQLTSSHRDPLIVRSTIDLAHALEMEVVAEGVETAASLALLSVMGCDMVQGYLVSRPLALEALLAFLRDERHLAVAGEARSPLERLAAVRARG